MGKLENKFQAELIKEIKSIFPESMVLKNDPSYKQGIPDLLIMYKNKWIDEKKFNTSMEQIYELGKIIGGLIKYYGKNLKK